MIENENLPTIWRTWNEDDDDQGMGWDGRTLEDVAGRELKDQKFYDDIFHKVKAFLVSDLAKMLGDHTVYMSAGSIRDFIMARLLPVDGDTVVKFLKIIRCSWDRTRAWDVGSLATLQKLPMALMGSRLAPMPRSPP